MSKRVGHVVPGVVVSLWSGLVSRVGASHGVNPTAPFPLGQNCPRKMTRKWNYNRGYYVARILRAGMAPWREHSPLTSVAWVRFGPGVICRLGLLLVLTLLWGFFSGFSGFFPLNNQHSKFQFDQDRLATRNSGKADVASSRNLVIYRAKKEINFKFNILFLLICPEKWIWALPFHFRRSINVAQTHLGRRTFFSTYCGVLLRIKKNVMWNHIKERPLDFHQEQRENNIIMRTERFSFESRKVIGYVSLCNSIALKKTRHWK